MTEFVTTTFGDLVAYDRYEAAAGDGGEAGAGRVPEDRALPTVVFVAGAGPYRAIDPITAPTAESLAAAGITAIVYDRIGRGESNEGGIGAQPVSLERELAAVEALIHVGGGSAVLCGHSSGCSISLAAATKGLPVAGLLLWEAPLGGITGGTREWADEISRRIARGDLEGALVHYMKDMPPEWLEGVRHSPLFPAMAAQVGSQMADAESLAWADSAPLGQLLGRIDVPVEAVYGEETQPIMVTAAEAIAAAVPDATAKRMPGANHSWQPESMAAELVRFVRAAAAHATSAAHTP